MALPRTTQWILGCVLVLCVAVATLTAEPAGAAEPPPGTTWSETFIDTPDGERLHTDIIHPTNLPAEAGPRPVLLVVSPYLGITGDEAAGPVNRFNDFYLGAYGGEGIFANGWSVVQVSLRGTGGSSGCLDILGPGEQTDVATAVDWVNRQPWADGIAMYGKSYDANTGAAAAALRPEGLDAIIAQAIAPDRYRGSYNERVRLAQSLLYPSATYGTQGEGGFSTASSPEAIGNSLSRTADCQVWLAEHYSDNEAAPFWRVRDFVDRAKGSKIPTFITAGYVDPATNIGAGAIDLFNALRGPKHLWVGWWDHVRGNDKVKDEFATGRSDFLAQVTAFLEHHVRGVPRSKLRAYPRSPIAAQGSDGTWRTEQAFPPADATKIDIAMRPGAYEDDGSNLGSNDQSAGAGGLVPDFASPGNGHWTFTKPLSKRTQVTGIPVATVTAKPTAPRSNLVVNVYDISRDGKATMITRGAALIDTGGEYRVRLFPTDWTFAKGHRIGVLASGSNMEAYTHVPTNTTVTVAAGRVSLPVLPKPRAANIAGTIAPRLRTYRENAPFDVSAQLEAAGAR